MCVMPRAWGRRRRRYTVARKLSIFNAQHQRSPPVSLYPESGMKTSRDVTKDALKSPTCRRPTPQRGWFELHAPRHSEYWRGSVLDPNEGLAGSQHDRYGNGTRLFAETSGQVTRRPVEQP